MAAHLSVSAATEFRERVFRERNGLGLFGKFLESKPAAGDELGALLCEVGIEESAIEIPFDGHGREVGGFDELGIDGVAAEVSFGCREQMAGGEFADDESEIQVAVPNGFHLVTADVTEVALFTASHGGSSEIAGLDVFGSINQGMPGVQMCTVSRGFAEKAVEHPTENL